MSTYVVHHISYEALIKGTARIVLPLGADPRDYEHLLANHEIHWNIHSIHSREVTSTQTEREIQQDGSMLGDAVAFVARASAAPAEDLPPSGGDSGGPF